MVALLTLSGAPLPAAVAATALIRIATLWFAVAGCAALLGLETFGSRPAAAGRRVS